jgi:hypothetical protein
MPYKIKRHIEELVKEKEWVPGPAYNTSLGILNPGRYGGKISRLPR